MKGIANNGSNRRQPVGRVAPRAPLGDRDARRARSDAPYRTQAT